MENVTTTTIGELATRSRRDERGADAFAAVVDSVDLNFPSGWRSWEVYDLTYEYLFGDEISSNVECKLRFAIPTTELAKAFLPECQSLSERKYRAIRTKMIKWPLGRALLYAPQDITAEIHCPGHSYLAFMDAVHSIKKLLTTRSRASSELQTSQQEDRSLRISTSTPVSTRDESPNRTSNKRKRSVNATSKETGPTAAKQPTPSHGLGSSEHVLITVLNQQMEMFNRIMSVQQTQNESLGKFLESHHSAGSKASSKDIRDLNSTLNSTADSTQSEAEDNGKQILTM